MTDASDPVEQDWEQLMNRLKLVLGKKPDDMNAVLFLIGVQELGKGKKNFSKEEKQDLMHIAICRLLSQSGYYEFEGKDEDGWPHWKLVEKVPYFDLLEQEKLLKTHIIDYFAEQGI